MTSVIFTKVSSTFAGRAKASASLESAFPSVPDTGEGGQEAMTSL